MSEIVLIVSNVAVLFIEAMRHVICQSTADNQMNEDAMRHNIGKLSGVCQSK